MIRRLTAACAAVVLSVSVALAAGGVQLTPDGTCVLASKDVGAERWSITLDFERGTVSGNVYRTNGAPAFVWCVLTGANENPDPAKTIFEFGCFGADRCFSTPCVIDEEWVVLGPVAIPGSFFLP